MIPEKLLLERGGSFRKYKKNESIFFEGNIPAFYYQIVSGSIKMVSVSENGKEFLQGIFISGQSFGEPVLLIDKTYPASAVANEDSVLIKLRKDEFTKILKEFPEIHLHFTKIFAKQIYYKSLIAKAIAISGPENRVLSILKILKDNVSGENFKKYKVELSRQQIADMIGFRVETVIRTIKNLEKQKIIKIQKGKIYL